jgi:hypothetical protein
MEALRREGAPGGEVGVIRSFKNDQNVTFSEHCPGCQRWTHLGRAEREGQCFCGQNYRVVFDQTPENWSRPLEMRCMDCGVQLTVPLEGARMNPWNPINGHQIPDRVQHPYVGEVSVSCQPVHGRRTNAERGGFVDADARELRAGIRRVGTRGGPSRAQTIGSRALPQERNSVLSFGDE